MIHTLPTPKTKKKGKQVGRGTGSGKGGHTTGRGTKGQKSRSGYKKPTPGFEGGQNPISRRLPKLRGTGGRGKNVNINFFRSKRKSFAVKLSEVAAVAKASDTINMEFLQNNGFVTNVTHKNPVVKILFDKDIDAKLKVEGIAVSQKVRESIEKAGGSVA